MTDISRSKTVNLKGPWGPLYQRSRISMYVGSGYPSPKRERGVSPAQPVACALGSDRSFTFAHGHLVGGRRGFTLIEMLVVITIIIITLTLVLPSARTMWDQRKIADAENTIRGLLMTARARALRASGVESGLLFYVDRNGAQRVVSIEQDDQGQTECTQACLEKPPGQETPCVQSCLVTWENVFRVTEDRQLPLPRPMRAVPRYVVESEGAGIDDSEVFSDEELANNLFDPAERDSDEAQRHRNYFTMIFSSSGQLLIRRDVLIRDDGQNDEQRDGIFGDLTGMRVGHDFSGDDDHVGEPNVRRQYRQDTNEPMPIDATARPGDAVAVPFLVIDEQDGVAINFPSVDGLLVYDDSLLNDLESDEEKRDFLLRMAQPFYVSRMTGEVIRGPRGEAQ